MTTNRSNLVTLVATPNSPKGENFQQFGHNLTRSKTANFNSDNGCSDLRAVT